MKWIFEIIDLIAIGLFAGLPTTVLCWMFCEYGKDLYDRKKKTWETSNPSASTTYRERKDIQNV